MIHRAVLVWLADHVRLRYVCLVIFIQIFLRLKLWVTLSQPGYSMYRSINLYSLIIVPIVSHHVILEDLAVSAVIMVVFLVFLTKLVEDVKLQILPVGFLTMLLSIMSYLRYARSLSDLKSVKFVALL